MSNLGIIYSQYQNGGITLTQKFGITTIANGLSGVYIPTVSGATVGNFAAFDAGGILADSGKKTSDFATSSQGAKADSAVQSVSIASGAANGRVALTVDGNTTEASVTGLGTAAYQESTAFASAAQGAKADTAVQSVSLTSGTNNGTLKLTVGGSATDNIAVKGLGTAAYQESATFATAAQGEKADSALQASDIVDNLASTSVVTPLSANQGRILQQRIQAISAGGKPIGGFLTYADRYTNTSQFAADLQPINVQDYIYIAADENHTDQPAQYAVASISANGAITYSFVKIVPDSARDFTLNPITSAELDADAVTSINIQPNAVTTGKIEDGAITDAKLSVALKETLTTIGNAVQSPINTSGAGNVVTGVMLNQDNELQITYGNAVDPVQTAGSGNAVASISADGGTLTQTMETLVQSVTKTGSGNAITGATTDASGNVSLSSDTFLQTVSVSGNGNTVTGVSASGGVITVTKGDMISSIPDASTTGKGAVQLNDTLTSASTSQALTANQGRILNANIASVDDGVVHKTNSETITGTKTFSAHPVVPSKTVLPASPSSTQYATEAQAATRYAKISDAVTNNVVAFGANGALQDTGIPYTNINNISLSATTPTNLNGIIKGNGSTISAATPGTDYTAASHLTDSDAHSAVFAQYATSAALGAHTGNSDIHVTAADKTAWSGKQAAITASGILKGNGTAVSAAVAGTDYAPAYSPVYEVNGDMTLHPIVFGKTVVCNAYDATLILANATVNFAEFEIINNSEDYITVLGSMEACGASVEQIRIECGDAVAFKAFKGAWLIIGKYTVEV